ncbi:MAG: formylglycine-generating enzyme family protein [Mariprofundaceae bacterium]|nr:formylglycine-generating enzyme family protein [Mariprofundaceae bacterium]
MVVIPAGDFRMGGGSEYPVHDVHIKAFMIGKYELSQTQWLSIMGSNPSEFKGGSNPVDSVSWNDVQVFLQKLNALSDHTFRLPTEAEWAYATRAGTNNAFSWQRDDLDPMPNDPGIFTWFRFNSDAETHPVGKKLPNGYGLYDMHGNVGEWTQDCWNESYDGAPTDGSAWLSGDCDKRVNRGGNYGSTLGSLRAAFRDARSASAHSRVLGFRLVRE